MSRQICYSISQEFFWDEQLISTVGKPSIQKCAKKSAAQVWNMTYSSSMPKLDVLTMCWYMKYNGLKLGLLGIMGDAI